MTDIELNPQGEVVLNVDKSIYNESTIDKVLYWWGGRLHNHPAKHPGYDRSDDYHFGFESDHAGGIP